MSYGPPSSPDYRHPRSSRAPSRIARGFRFVPPRTHYGQHKASTRPGSWAGGAGNRRPVYCGRQLFFECPCSIPVTPPNWPALAPQMGPICAPPEYASKGPTPFGLFEGRALSPNRPPPTDFCPNLGAGPNPPGGPDRRGGAGEVLKPRPLQSCPGPPGLLPPRPALSTQSSSPEVFNPKGPLAGIIDQAPPASACWRQEFSGCVALICPPAPRPVGTNPPLGLLRPPRNFAVGGAPSAPCPKLFRARPPEFPRRQAPYHPTGNLSAAVFTPFPTVNPRVCLSELNTHPRHRGPPLCPPGPPPPSIAISLSAWGTVGPRPAFIFPVWYTGLQPEILLGTEKPHGARGFFQGLTFVLSRNP